MIKILMLKVLYINNKNLVCFTNFKIFYSLHFKDSFKLNLSVVMTQSAGPINNGF